MLTVQYAHPPLCPTAAAPGPVPAMRGSNERWDELELCEARATTSTWPQTREAWPQPHARAQRSPELQAYAGFLRERRRWIFAQTSRIGGIAGLAAWGARGTPAGWEKASHHPRGWEQGERAQGVTAPDPVPAQWGPQWTSVCSRHMVGPLVSFLATRALCIPLSSSQQATLNYCNSF